MIKGPPTRFRDDPAAARALRTDLARAAAHPRAPYDLAAGRARFEETLRAGSAAGSGSSAGPGAAAGGKTLIGAVVKGTLLLGVAVLGGAAALQDGSPSPSPIPPAAIAAAPAMPADDERPAPESTAPPPEPPPPPPLVTAKPPIVSGPSHAPVVSRASAAPAPAAPPSTADALIAEVEHLARLRALQDRDPAGALALAAYGAQRFPTGLFAQEREAIAVGALVRLVRTAEARTRATAFLAAYPRSPFAERIRKLTGIGDAR
jgi:hypothetical protein